ncbi:putative GNAT family acetyltransferase [Anaerosolibacter carboniphilus]|uniref:Putative GNAT family acetyltransferase n=1 Tax=Anaerosolibacter carboniphilus TaxID=1417629 RepID=A0A841KPL0_9FIRM|nr:GNAT family N-acetyltransferase [Anaerosolibacter carboniphilus]MBB6214028.1 putative GNAT family acetyltransferase [Anaerosolibacter carboniphilus]
MLIKTEISQTILEFLRTDLPVNLNILGILDNVPHVEIYVDHVEHPRGVLIKKDYFHYLYTKEDHFIDAVMDQFFREGFYGFSGIEGYIAEKIMKKYDVTWTSPCTLYYMPKENLNLKLIKNPVQSIALEDAAVVDHFYTYRNEQSLETIRRDIQERPSSAIYVDGEIACWVLIHDDDSMGIMYTKDTHRKKGYAVDVTIDLASKTIEKGKMPFLQIVEGNNMSPGLAKKCGFVEWGKVTWFGIVAGTPKELIEGNNREKELFLQSFPKDGKGTYFIPQGAYEGRYIFLYGYKGQGVLDIKVQLEEIQSEDTLYQWCGRVVKNYDVPKEKQNEAQSMVMGMMTHGESRYKCYVGKWNGEIVATAALLAMDDTAQGLYFLSVEDKYRRRGVGTAMVGEILKLAKENEQEVLFTQSPQEYAGLFEGLGMKRSHQEEIFI